jgi:hypothetical protein
MSPHRFVTQRNKPFVQMHNSPNRACYLASIALNLSDRSREVSSGEAAFVELDAGLGSIAIFAYEGGYA